MADSFEHQPTVVVPREELSRIVETARSARSAGSTSTRLASPAPDPTGPPEPSVKDRAGFLAATVLSFSMAFVLVLIVADVWLQRRDLPVEPGLSPTVEESPEELASSMAALAAEFEQANRAVEVLQRRVEDQKREVEALERRLEQEVAAERTVDADAATKRAGLERELASAREALARSRRQLEIELAKLESALRGARAAERGLEAAIAELSEARGELDEARTALSGEVEQKERMTRELEASQWLRFVLSAQLQVCERGSRGQLEACRAKVEQALATRFRRSRFLECIGKGGERPTIRRVDRQAPPPDPLALLDPDDRALADWTLTFCEPTAPDVAGGREVEPRSDSVVAVEISGASEPPALLDELAEVGIETSPAGASVEIDGKSRGRTPIKLRLTRRPHTISVQLDGAETSWKVSSATDQVYCFVASGPDLVPAECGRPPDASGSGGDRGP